MNAAQALRWCEEHGATVIFRCPVSDGFGEFHETEIVVGEKRLIHHSMAPGFEEAVEGFAKAYPPPLQDPVREALYKAREALCESGNATRREAMCAIIRAERELDKR